MDASIRKDIEDLNSQDERIYSSAFLNLVARKSEAVPALKNLLEQKDQMGRALAAEALANIADNSDSDFIYNFINDKDEKIRSWSAVALMRMGDPRAFESLIRTINDSPDILHSDQTLSSYALSQCGESILLRLIKYLNDPDLETRQHILAVFKKIIYNKMKTKDAWEGLWRTNGAYDPEMKESERKKCIEKWKLWLLKNP